MTTMGGKAGLVDGRQMMSATQSSFGPCNVVLLNASWLWRWGGGPARAVEFA